MTALLHLISWFVGLWPEAWVTAYAEVTGAAWFHVLRYRRRVILENLGRAFPELSEAERRALGHRACVHLVRSLLEVFRIPRYRRRGFENVRIDGIEHFDEAKQLGKGVLCLSGHFGTPDLCVGAVARRAAPISIVVKPFAGPVDRFITKVREDCGLGVIRPGSGRRAIFRALKKNETVVAVLDQNATRSIGVFVDFFGTPACTMSYLATYAVSLDVPVVAAVPYREADGQHVLRVYPMIPLEPQATREETIAHMTAVYTRFIEDAIRAHPEQWFWQHKRWRTRPAPT